MCHFVKVCHFLVLFGMAMRDQLTPVLVLIICFCSLDYTYVVNVPAVFAACMCTLCVHVCREKQYVYPMYACV